MKLTFLTSRTAVVRSVLAAVIVLLSGILTVHTLAPPQKRVGPLSDGGFLLNSGWTIRPAGQQVPVDTFPMSSVVTNNGKYMLVLNGGYNPPSVSVIDIEQKKGTRADAGARRLAWPGALTYG